jgi:hypothetical protein
MGSNVRCNEVASKQTRCHVATRGQQHRAVAGGSTGSGQIAQSRSLEMPFRIDLPAFLLDIVTNGR